MVLFAVLLIVFVAACVAALSLRHHTQPDEVAELEADLRERVRVLGPDHPMVVAVRHELANSWGRAGDRGRAVAALEQVLCERLWSSGAGHPDTLRAREDLARWRELSERG